MSKQEIMSHKGSLPPWPQEGEATELFERFGMRGYELLYDFEQVQHLYARYQFGGLQVRMSADEEYQVACHRWQVERPKAEYVLVHGLFDHVGLYLPLVKYLLQRQFNVIAFDLPEHGLSSGEHGDVGDFSVYAQSLRQVLDLLDGSDTEPDAAGTVPRVLFGQSTGGAVIMRYLSDMSEENYASRGGSVGGSSAVQTKLPFDRCVFAAPLLRVRGWRRIQFAYHAVAWLLKAVPRDFTRNSHDLVFHDFLENSDPLQPRSISTRWVGAMIAWAKQFEDLALQQVPCIYIQGSEDGTVDAAYNVPAILAKFKNITLYEVEGAFHHLVREGEPWRTEVYELICSAAEA